MKNLSLYSPFCRDKKRDFAHVSGLDLLTAKIKQVLATEGTTPHGSGEMPWRTEFGSAVHLLCHQRNHEALAALARVYVRDAVIRWVPDARIDDIHVFRDGATLSVEVFVTSHASNEPQRIRVEL